MAGWPGAGPEAARSGERVGARERAVGEEPGRAAYDRFDGRGIRRTRVRPQRLVLLAEIVGEDTVWLSNDGSLNRPGVAQTQALMSWPGMEAAGQFRAGKSYYDRGFK